MDREFLSAAATRPLSLAWDHAAGSIGDMTSERSETALREIRALFGEGTVAGLADPRLLGRFSASRDEAAFAALVAAHGP